MRSFLAVLWLSLRLQLAIVAKKQSRKRKEGRRKEKEGLGSSKAISIQHPNKKGGKRKKQRAITSPERENEATVARV